MTSDEIKQELVNELLPKIMEGFVAYPDLWGYVTNDQKMQVLEALGLEYEATENKARIKILFMDVTATTENGKANLQITIDPSFFEKSSKIGA